MKNYYVKIMFLFIILFLVLYGNPVKADLPMQGKVIVVDAGHGGLDPGAIYKDIYEKDITLNISKYLYEYLSSCGATVIMTRDSDSDLSNGVNNHRKKKDFDERIKIINKKYVDMYVSIHLNYLTDYRYNGPQVFFNKDNKDIAVKIQEYINEKLGTDRSVKKIPGDTYMYRKLNSKGVLVECGFLSNKEERDKLITEEYQKEFAKILGDAIINYYN